MTTPVWSLARAQRGMTRMKTLDKYSDDDTPRDPTQHIGHLLRTAPDWSYLGWLRAHWKGPLIIKGILHPEDAKRAQEEGADAVWVSNHAGRQFDATPAAIEALPAVRAATSLPLIFDSGVEGGLDVLRAFALGADFVMLGRAWHYALGALGAVGATHLTDMLRKDISANLGQLGVAHPRELRGKAFRLVNGVEHRF
jgi:L-lactate dehydrogenase (cytochrome)